MPSPDPPAPAPGPPSTSGATSGWSASAQELIDRLLPRCTFGDQPLVCAVSGGADSLALLVLAVAWAADAARWPHAGSADGGAAVTAVHVDHGLRAGSAGEADVVAAACERLGARFEALRVQVAPGPNLEARAREARFGALPHGAATGHTADDQAETVVLNLLRGSGLDGLAGMRPGPQHPILGLRRTDTVALCAACGLDPVVDPSNAELRHLRNRVRHEILPALSAAATRDLVPILTRQAALLRDEAAVLDELAAAIDPTDARALAAAPVALARRAVRRWLADPYPPDAATVERVLAVARGEQRACELDGARRVERSHRRLRLVSPEPTAPR